MEDNRRGGNGRRDGRREYGERRSHSNNGERRSFSSNGERRSFGSDRPRRSFSENGERRSFSDNRERRPYGENSERRSFSSNGERRSFGSDRPRRSFSENGERRSFSGNRERRPYGENSERRSFSSDRPRRSFSDNGERRSFSSDRPRRSYSDNGERRSYGNNERRSFGENSERRSFGGDRPRRSFSDNGERRSYGNRNERRGFGNSGRKSYNRKDLNYFRNEDESGISRMISRRPQVDGAEYSDNDMVKTPIKEEIRLNKFIANSGVCSRREADNFILAGVVTVNGEVVTELGTKVNIKTDDIRFNGERLKGEDKVYIVMNKPKGYVTTASDPHADKTVMDLLKNCNSRVFPVGRLDKNTTGVLMFTNDGEIAEKLTHPSYDDEETYRQEVQTCLHGGMRHYVHALERLSRSPQAVCSFRAGNTEDPHVHGIFEQSGGRQRHLCYKEGTCRRTDPCAYRQHGKGA